MISRYRVSLDNVQMDSLDSNLRILDVGYSPLEKQVKQNVTADLDGYDIAQTVYTQRVVTVTFELHIYGIAERNAACQKVNEWAKNGGTLRINDRNKQMLTVTCSQLADIASARNWTDPLTIVFTSTYSPFWRSEDQRTLTLTGKNSSGTFKLDGNIGEALVSVTATAKATVSSFQITVGETTLKLTGISVGVNKQIVIDYIRNRYLRIRVDGNSVLTKLDPASSDNLRAKCGDSTPVSITANNSVTTMITARGCWL